MLLLMVVGKLLPVTVLLNHPLQLRKLFLEAPPVRILLITWEWLADMARCPRPLPALLHHRRLLLLELLRTCVGSAVRRLPHPASN